MTPKEKAEELVQQIIDIKNVKLSDYSVIYHPTARKIALKMVDEIIKSREEDNGFDDRLYSTSEYHAPHPMYLTYWLQVKEEIEKL